MNGLAAVECGVSGYRGADPLQDKRQYLAGLGDYLDRFILGQRLATARLARAIQAAELEYNERRNKQPKASFILFGPTGVGKTESTKRFTQYLYGDETKIAMFFMNEYGAEETILDFKERLETAIRRHPDGTSLLFDEVEKAHQKIVDIFISLVEEGMFTVKTGEKLSIENFYVVMTSNLGSSDLVRMESSPFSLMERTVLAVAGERLRPELLLRFSERIVFRPLGLDIQREIIRHRIEAKLEILSRRFGRALTYDADRVIAFVFRSDTKGGQGARLLAQEVDRQFNLAALPWGLSGKIPKEGRFYYDAAAGALVLR